MINERVHSRTHYNKSTKMYSFVLQVLRKTKSISTIKSITTDGARNMTGAINGFIRRTEVKLHKALFWIVCLLHLDELVFRHLFEEIGKTAGF